jgi:hypothetical protein
MTDTMSYVQTVMQSQLASVRVDMQWEQQALDAAQVALASAQEKLQMLKTQEAELVAHLKANGWPEVAPTS